MDKSVANVKTRWLWLCGIAVFVFGVVIGILISIVGFKHMVFGFRPKPDDMARHIAMDISTDFHLPPACTEKIEKVILSYHPEIEEIINGSFEKIDEVKQRMADDIASMIEDKQSRREWLANYEDYFPKSPPRLPPHFPDGGRDRNWGPPPPPPGSHGAPREFRGRDGPGR